MIRIKLSDCVIEIDNEKITCNPEHMDFLVDDMVETFKKFGSPTPTPEIGLALFIIKELGEGVIIYSDEVPSENFDGFTKKKSKILLT